MKVQVLNFNDTIYSHLFNKDFCYDKLDKEFLTIVHKELPDITIELLKDSDHCIFTREYNHYTLSKDEYDKYVLELRNIYWKVILKEIVKDINKNYILNWYSLLQTPGSYLSYPLNSDDCYYNYMGKGRKYSPYYYLHNSGKLYTNIECLRPYLLDHLSDAFIREMVIIDIISDDNLRQILINNTLNRYDFLIQLIKNKKDLTEDILLEFKFYYCADNYFDIKKLFIYEKEEIVLC